ncbi:MAG: GNAT family N-acetyltransferase, partial [Terriglobia bacterium]
MAGQPSRIQIKVRPLAAQEAERIAELATQLGYPSTAEQIETRLKQIADGPGHLTLVAENSQGLEIGWLDAFINRTVESDPWAEIAALIVDRQSRGQGAGRELLARAEAWARAQGVRTVRVRSNIVREVARDFYIKLGFTLEKTQHAF